MEIDFNGNFYVKILRNAYPNDPQQVACNSSHLNLFTLLLLFLPNILKIKYLVNLSCFHNQYFLAKTNRFFLALVAALHKFIRGIMESPIIILQSFFITRPPLYGH